MTKTTLDTAPSLLSPRRQYMQRIRLAWQTNGLTQNCWSSNAETTAKQPHTYPTSGAAKQPHPSTAAKKQPHPIYCCEETATPHCTILLSVTAAWTAPSTSTILGITTKPKKLASTLLQNSSSPLQKEPLLVLWWSQNWQCIKKWRTRSRITESSSLGRF